MKKIYGYMIMFFLSFLFIIGSLTVAFCEEPWKDKLLEVCGKTDEANALSTQELKDLIGKCDKLQPQIDALDESTRKTYGNRLKKCRNLFAFVLESKTKTK